MLTDKLIEKGIIDKEKGSSIKELVRSTGQKEEEVLLSQDLIGEEELFQIKSEVSNIPFKKDVLPVDVSLDVLKLIPQRTAEHYKMLALSKSDSFLEVGMVYPEDLNAQEALKFLSRKWNLEVKVYLILPSSFKDIFKRYGSLREEVSELLHDEDEDKKEERRKEQTTLEDMKKMVEKAPVSKAVNSILEYAVQKGASDIHIEPERKKLRVRFRLLGSLQSSVELPLRFHGPIASRIKILSSLKLDEKRIPQDGRFSSIIEERGIDFRVSTFPTTLGEKVVMRVLDSEAGLQNFEELGFSDRDMKTINRTIQKPYGLILATGPTGSGKSTTLYSALRVLNKEDVNIVTLEDPVEYFIQGVNQSQVRPEIGYTFARGLRHIVRQDPDVIMVGEIRDEETASLSVHAALTGHIVLSTLHTNNAVGAVPRFIDLGVQPFLVPSTISLVIAQRLVRILCNHCKEKVKPNPEENKVIMDAINNLPAKAKGEIDIPKPFYIWKAKGCRHCADKGYVGRIGLFEIFEMTNRLADAKLENLSEDALEKEARKQGMTTMRQDGVLKALKGLTSLSEVVTSTQVKEY